MKMQEDLLETLLFLLFVAGIAASEEILLNFYTTHSEHVLPQE
jgi:hypothetical protein